jgi:glycosyltransferase involved in cell wall biosynthesis
MRILLAAPESTGGIGRHVVTVAQGLVARGHAVTVCAPAQTLERLNPESVGARAVALDLGTVRSALVDRRVLSSLAAEHDVAHAHGVRVGAQLAFVGTPLLVTWHNAPLGPPPRRAVHGLLERICARRAEVVLGASSDLVARARAAGAGDARLCAVVAAYLQAPAPAPAATERGSDSSRRPPTVLTVARLHPQKRLDLLVAAAASWPTGPDRPRFVVAGDGPLLDALREQARVLEAPVTFLGARTDVAALLADADVVALPSDWEARPLVAQEALRAGVPLVATDVGGVRELVGDAALVVPPGDAVALADGIRRVLTDVRLRERLRRDGPVRAATWPSVAEMVDELIDVYRELRRRT